MSDDWPLPRDLKRTHRGQGGKQKIYGDDDTSSFNLYMYIYDITDQVFLLSVSIGI